MSVPILVLLGFAGWTLLVVFGSVGVNRWSLILTGRASLAEWRADLPQGSDLASKVTSGLRGPLGAVVTAR